MCSALAYVRFLPIADIPYRQHDTDFVSVVSVGSHRRRHAAADVDTGRHQRSILLPDRGWNIDLGPRFEFVLAAGA